MKSAVKILLVGIFVFLGLYQTELHAEDNSRIKMIAVFNDVAPLKKLKKAQLYSQVEHTYVMKSLQKNAVLSQQSAIQKLKSMKLGGVPIQYQSYWLFNGMVITLPKSQLNEIKNLPGLRSLEPNRVIKLEPVLRKATKALSQRRFTTAYTYGLEKLRIPQLRDQIPTATGKGVRVGVLDTGADVSHPDLKERLVGWRDFINRRSDAYDDQGHGTHVSGILAGGSYSGTAIGVAPDAKLIVGKIFSSEGQSTSEIILSGMQWIADPDGNPLTNDAPRLVSNSWGDGFPVFSDDPNDFSTCIAVSHWAALGILPVFAVGNSGPYDYSVKLPAACPYALAVGATDQNDQIANFSSRGPVDWKNSLFIKPNVTAPGVKVLSTIPGGKYAEWDGTSMATPHIAGVSALIIQAHPDWSVEKIATQIMSTAQDLGEPGKDNTYGAGRANAYDAVTKSLFRGFQRLQ